MSCAPWWRPAGCARRRPGPGRSTAAALAGRAGRPAGGRPGRVHAPGGRAGRGDHRPGRYRPDRGPHPAAPARPTPWRLLVVAGRPAPAPSHAPRVVSRRRLAGCGLRAWSRPPRPADQGVAEVGRAHQEQGHQLPGGQVLAEHHEAGDGGHRRVHAQQHTEGPGGDLAQGDQLQAVGQHRREDGHAAPSRSTSG